MIALITKYWGSLIGMVQSVLVSIITYSTQHQNYVEWNYSHIQLITVATTWYIVDSIANRCHSTHHRHECSIELLHSGLSTGKATYNRNIMLFDKIPFMSHLLDSYIYSYIYSNPKIEIVDYVTYIFGIPGTWWGFSLLVINPITR